MSRFEIEVFDPDAREWERLAEHDARVEWGPSRALLSIGGVPALVRFRVWQLVSAGTDRILMLDAIPGLTLYSRTSW